METDTEERSQSLLAQQNLPRLKQFLLVLLAHRWIVEVQTAELLEHHPPHGQPRKPFSIRRYDMPRRPLAAGVVEDIFVGLHVVVPTRPFLDVTNRELPILICLINPLEKPFLL